MSGRAIGTIAGAVIGFYFGGPQGAYYGAMLGGMAGGLIDPETLQGAQFSGNTLAGSESGLGRPIIFGTAVCEGRLLDGEPNPRVTKADVGKGGPEVKDDTALWSGSIEICESSELRGTKVEAVLAVWEDEKLVYDVRENSLVSSVDNAKWLENKKFWYGEEDQATSALLEAIHGVGNVPAYVGTCRMDMKDEDFVPHGSRLPRYRFLVSRCPVSPPTFLLVTGDAIGSGAPMWAAATVGDDLSFTGIPQSSGADFPRGTPAYRNNVWIVAGDEAARISTDNRVSWQSIPNDHAGYGFLAFGPKGCLLARPAGPASGYDKTAKALPIQDGFESYAFQTSVRVHGEESAFCRYVGGYYWLDTGAQGELVKTAELGDTLPVIYNRGAEAVNAFAAFWDIEVDTADSDTVYAVGQWGTSSPRAQLRKSSDGGETFPDLLIDKAITDADAPLQLQFGNGYLIAQCRGDAYVWTSADGFAASHATGIAGDRTANPPKYAHQDIGRHICYAQDGRFYLISGTSTASPTIGNKCVWTEDGLTFSDPVSLPIDDLYGIAASTAYEASGGGIIIPDAPGYEIDPITGLPAGPGGDIGNACGMYLDDVVREIYRLGAKQLTDSVLDLDALSIYYVRGYTLQDVGITSADGIEPLRRVYFFDLPEYDGKIHARLRAGDIDWVIDPDDIIPGEESTLEGKRGDQTKFPKKLNLTYRALSTDYKPTTQIAEDINPDTFTNTEENYQTALVLEDDEAAKVVDVMLKVMRVEAEDEQTFSLPIQYIGIIASDILSIEGRRYRVDKMRVEKNRVVIERAVRDSQHAYYSEAVGVAGISRPPPVSSVRGPVASAVMNSPVLRIDDDRAGVYWAASGYLSGYVGARLQVSRDGVNFEDGPEIETSSTMGLLTADLPAASRYVQDNTSTLRVRMYPGGSDLNSTNFTGLMEGVNAAAVVYPSGKIEIIQFQTAVETSDLVYELTGLMRGRQDTEAGLHLEGAQFVLLNEDVRFVAIRPEDLGKTLTFRAVSIGTNPDDNATQDVTFNTIESLREWRPYNIVVTPGFSEDPEEEAGAGYCVEWIGRARLGTSRTPVHSQWFAGYEVKFTVDTLTYTAITQDQSLCVSYDTLAESLGLSFGWPTVTVRALSRVATNDDDFDSEPADPVTPEVPDTSGGGAPASPGLGPNGGYPDDTPYWIPEPDVLGTDVIGTDGEFNDASALTAWRTRLGALLGADWEIVDGRAQHTGRVGEAYGYKWRQSLPSQPFDRFSVEVEGSLQTALGKTAQIGIAWGVNTNPAAGAEAPNYLELSDATNYAEETTASHTWLRASQTASMSPYGFYTHVNFMPYVRFVDEYERISIGSIDDVTMVITPVSVALSSAALDHIDFDSGLTGWTVWPDPTLADPDWPDLTTSAGTITMESHHATKTFRNVYCDDPIDSADAAGKYVKVVAEVTCDDPSVDARGITTGGAHIFLASKATSNGYALNGLYVAQRGDKTQRTWWWRVQGAPGGDLLGWHVCIQMRAADGYMVKVKIISVEVTDDPQD